jgi:hypothetical protein
MGAGLPAPVALRPPWSFHLACSSPPGLFSMPRRNLRRNSRSPQGFPTFCARQQDAHVPIRLQMDTAAVYGKGEKKKKDSRMHKQRAKKSCQHGGPHLHRAMRGTLAGATLKEGASRSAVPRKTPGRKGRAHPSFAGAASKKEFLPQTRS